MMHASDYANMGYDQMHRKMLENKSKEKQLSRSLQ